MGAAGLAYIASCNCIHVIDSSVFRVAKSFDTYILLITHTLSFSILENYCLGNPFLLILFCKFLHACQYRRHDHEGHRQHDHRILHHASDTVADK